jgi:uncharacterized protein (DUF488 family)
MPPNPIFTIGHSTRPIDDFAKLLAESDVRLVVDVRTVPRSRTNPQFNRDILPESLAAHGVDYSIAPRSGAFAAGRRALRPRSTHFGRTKVSTTTPTTP